MSNLFDGFSPNHHDTLRHALCLPISGVEINESTVPTITILFNDGSTLHLTDEGQSCCESRYITTDCDLLSYHGAQIYNIAVCDHPGFDEQPYGDHDAQTLRIYTTAGVMDFVTHNEHNGYYGGFNLCAHFTPAPGKPITPDPYEDNRPISEPPATPMATIFGVDDYICCSPEQARTLTAAFNYAERAAANTPSRPDTDCTCDFLARLLTDTADAKDRLSAARIVAQFIYEEKYRIKDTYNTILSAPVPSNKVN